MVNLSRISRIGLVCAIFLVLGHQSLLNAEQVFSIYRVVWSLNESNFALETSDGIWLYDLSGNLAAPRLVASCGEQTSDLVFAHTGLKIAYSTPDTGMVHIDDVQSNQELDSFDPPGDVVTDLDFNSDDTVLAVATAEQDPNYGFLQNGAVYLWNTAGNSDLSQLGKENEFPVALDLAFDSASSNLVVAGSSVGRDPNTSAVQLWDTKQGSKVGGLSWQSINALPVSNGSLVALSILDEYNENSIQVWNIKTNAKLTEISPSGQIFTSLALSADGTKLAATTRNGEAFIWNTTTGEQVASIENAGVSIRSLTFNPTADSLAFISSGANSEAQVQLYDLAGKVITTLPSPHWQEAHCS